MRINSHDKRSDEDRVPSTLSDLGGIFFLPFLPRTAPLSLSLFQFPPKGHGPVIWHINVMEAQIRVWRMRDT